MKAMVLAAGEGTRLHSIAAKIPKVLMPLNGISILEHTLLWLQNNNITDIAINLYHLRDQVKGFIGDGSKFGVNVFFSEEDSLLGTAGGVKKVEDYLGDTFLVVYGDVLTDIKIQPLVDFHTKNSAMATLLLCPLHHREDVGVVSINKQGFITTFSEKPEHIENNSMFMSGGIYILNKEILRFIPKNTFFDFAVDVFPQVIAAGTAIFGYIMKQDEYLLDMGTPERYRKANEDAEKGLIEVLRRCAP